MSQEIVSRLMKNRRRLEISLSEAVDRKIYESDKDDSTAPTQGDPDDYEEDDGDYTPPEDAGDDSFADEGDTTDIGDESDMDFDMSGGSEPINRQESEEPPMSTSEFDRQSSIEPGQYENPLKNPYSTHHTLGDDVSLSSNTGSGVKNMKGTIEGYDPEGFYRVKWDDGTITNGMTDIALQSLIHKSALKQDQLYSPIDNTNEGKCVCGNKKFIKEGNYTVCDICGRRLRESIVKRAYVIRYDFEGDGLSDYSGNVIVSAYSLERALELAKSSIVQGYNFRLDKNYGVNGVYPSLAFFKEHSPSSNWNIIEESIEDDLTKLDKERPKGKKLIRSESHPVSTSIKPNIDINENKNIK